MSVTSKARELVRDATRMRAEEEEQRLAVNWRCYRGVLERADEPLDSDASLLVELMNELQISEEQVAEDLQTVKRAKEFTALHGELDAAHAATKQQHDAYQELKKRHEAEEKEAWLAKARAEGHYSACHSAAGKLLELKRRRPELFDNGNPPCLIEPDPGV